MIWNFDIPTDYGYDWMRIHEQGHSILHILQIHLWADGFFANCGLYTLSNGNILVDFGLNHDHYCKSGLQRGAMVCLNQKKTLIESERKWKLLKYEIDSNF